MAAYELVFLDADETIFDFKKAEDVAFERTFEQYGLAPTAEARSAYDEINKGLWLSLERGEIDQPTLKVERFRRLFARLEASAPRSLDAIEPGDFGKAYVGWLSKGTFLIEGAEDICAYLGSKYTLAILTNGMREVQVPRFESSAIRRYVSRIVVSEDAGSSKPDPRIFDYACGLLGFRRKEAMIMIGDSLGSDIRGGADYGIDTCWVNFSRAPNATSVVPTYEIARLDELKRIL